MRAYVPKYEMIKAKDLSHALELLNKDPGVWKPFAGGTDLMVLYETGSLTHTKFLSLWNLQELKNITECENDLELGALTTYSQLRNSTIVQEKFPLLCRAAQETGALAIQNRGTLGGNIVNASPAADSPPALLVYDAQIEISSVNGIRWVPYHQFHLGYKKIDLKPDELITKIRLPGYSGALHHYYRKVGTRKAQAISKVCFAGTLKIESNLVKQIRIALGSIAPIPLRCVTTEKFLENKTLNSALIDQAKKILLKEIAPINDIRSTAEYRNAVAANLLEDFLCGTGLVN